MECICFGGGAAITRAEFPCFRRIVNYYSVNDPLLFVVPSAAKALQSGIFMATSGQESEYVFLTPRAGNPAMDHSLLGPTYREVLAWEGRRFQNQYQNAIVRKTRPAVLKAQEVCMFLLRVVVECFLMPIYLFLREQCGDAFGLVWEQLVVPVSTLLKLVLRVMVHYIRIWKDGGKYEPLVVT